MTDQISDERLTEYEIQVLIGTTIHGCNMAPDRVFSLDMAWHRLHSIGLIDRTDGLAIATDKGCAVVTSILSAARRAQPSTVSVDEWQPIETAPEGTRVLIFVPRAENVKNLPAGTEYIAYKTPSDPPFAQTWRYATGPGKGEHCSWPSHWQPLSPPPLNATQEGK